MQQLVLLLLLSNLIEQEIQCYLQMSSMIVTSLHNTKWSAINKWRHRIKEKRRRKAVTQRKKAKPRYSEQFDPDNIDVYERTGMFEGKFEELFAKLRSSIILPRSGRRQRIVSTVLEPRMRLLLALHAMKENLNMKTLSQLYHVDCSVVNRDLHHLIPKIYVELHEIEWPLTWQRHPFEELVGLIDCGSHFCYRVHPQQADLYQADKHGFFLTAQVVCGVNGIIYNIQLALGHNNDKGVFILTKMSDFLEEHQIRFGADRGYKSHHRVVKPSDSQSKEWNAKLCGIRSAVEVSIGMAETYSAAGEQCWLGLELHELVVMCAYQLTNMKLKQYPMRLFIE